MASSDSSAERRPAILVVEDELDIGDTLQVILERESFRVTVVRDGQTCVDHLAQHVPDVMLLDLMLPDIPGLEVLKSLKRDPRLHKVRTVILTAKNDEIDRVLGLELGADDYVAKPFSPRELVLRIRRLIDRDEERATPAPSAPAHRQISAGPIVVDLEFHEVRVAGEVLDLTLTEFRLLVELMQANGRVRSRSHLLSEIWGYDSEAMSRTVDTHIRRLRQKLGPAADWLVTVRGVGYQLRDPAGS